MENGRFLFVYGTLKRGQPLHYLLEGAEFVGEGFVEGFALYDLGSYPAARPRKGRRIRGEVFVVEDETLLEVLDEVEDEYRRTKVRVKLEGEEVEAFMYVYEEELPEELLVEGESWPS